MWCLCPPLLRGGELLGWEHPPHVKDSLNILNHCRTKPGTGCYRQPGSCHPPSTSRWAEHHFEELNKPSWSSQQSINTTALRSARWKPTTCKPGSPHAPASCCNSRMGEKQHPTLLAAPAGNSPAFAPQPAIAPRTAGARVWCKPTTALRLDPALLSGLHIFRAETNYQIRK